MNLLELYQNILEYCSFKTDNEGLVSIALGDKTFECTLEKKHIYLPTKENLRKFNPETDIIFHPFKEFINRGESPVVRKLRHTANTRLNYIIIMMMVDLIEVLESPALHARFTPQQRELLKAVGEVDKTTKLKLIDEMMAKMFVENPRDLIVNIYLKKHGTLHGQKHARVGVVTFPIYETLTKNKPASISTAAANSILKLLEFMFPGSRDDSESYSGFSDSHDIPWLSCLLNTCYNLTSRIEELDALYKDIIVARDYRKYNHNWLDEIANFNKYQKEINLIPALAGNEGAPDTPVQHTAVVPAVNEQNIQAALDKANTAPEPDTPKRDSPYNFNMQPVAAAPVVQQAPQTKNSNGELKFSSVVATNPFVAMSGMTQTPLTAAAQQQAYQAQMMKLMQNPQAMAQMMANTGWNMPMMNMPQQQNMMLNTGMMGMNNINPQMLQQLMMQNPMLAQQLVQQQQMQQMIGGVGMQATPIYNV